MIVGAGPREAEARVVAWVRANRPAHAGALWPPLRIVVPSRSLRRHLIAVLVREIGPLAGVAVQTHRAVAREILERAGTPLPRASTAAQEVLARALAAAEPGLARALGGLDDGYAPVAAAVRDLLDAGFEPTLLEAAETAVRGAGLEGDRLDRALAVLRVASATLGACARTGAPHRGTLLDRATALLNADGEALPARRILIHGFAEATGRVSALLEALVRRGAETVLDRPPDPARPAEPDRGGRFTDRLARRLAGGTPDWPAPPEPPRLEAYRAPGPEAEVREAARRIAARLEAGAVPERIGVVARSLDATTAAAIRRWFGRMGIPFSGEGATMPGGEPARRLRAAFTLLSMRGQAPVAAWLAVAAPLRGAGDTSRLDVAFRTLGVARLEEVAALDIARVCPGKTLPLPALAAEGGDGLRRAAIGREALEAARDAARDLLSRLGERPSTASPAHHALWTRHMLESLGIAGAAVEPLEIIETALDAVAAVAWEHVEPVLRRTLEGAEPVPLGGPGGGVQVLSVMEARSRTFDHLYLLALNRRIFPRRADDDPVFPSAARQALAPLLPEIPVPDRARLEERYLFAQIVASAPEVTLSWRTVDAEGRPLNRSAFVERLILEGRLAEEETPEVEDAFGETTRTAGPRPALEHAVLSALAGDRTGLAAVAREAGDPRAGYLAPLLDELDPPSPRRDTGAFLGTGCPGPPETLWATRLEAYSHCPWRQFLERELGLAPPPDVALATVRFGGMLTGRTVHAVLQRIVAEAGAAAGRGVTLKALDGAEPVVVPWPSRARLETLVREAARRTALAEGVPALAPALARAALPLLERAQEIDWREGRRAGVLGAEVEGECRLALAGGERAAVRFRADRVDREADGALVLTDYKTGKSNATIPTALGKGERLQAALYACGAGGNAKGRYVFLAARTRRTEEETGNGEILETLRNVLGVLLGAWRNGIAVPRWDDDDNRHGRCGRCPVADACFRDDSTFRLRLERAIAARRAENPADPLVRLWDLPRQKKNSTKRGGRRT